MMDEIIDLVLINICVLSFALILLATETIVKRHKQRLRRRWWVTPLLRRRRDEGAYNVLLSKSVSDGFYYENYLRMDKNTFLYVLSKIEHLISCQNTQMRQSITAAEKLTVTLRYLATVNNTVFEISAIHLIVLLALFQY